MHILLEQYGLSLYACKLVNKNTLGIGHTANKTTRALTQSFEICPMSMSQMIIRSLNYKQVIGFRNQMGELKTSMSDLTVIQCQECPGLRSCRA